MRQETSPASRRQLPTYSLTQKGSGSQIPTYSAGTFSADEQHQLAQPMHSAPSGRYGSAGVASPGRPQRQRAPPPPERHMSPGFQESRRGRVLPTGPPSDQYAGEAASTNSFGFGSGSSNRNPQQKAIQSRRNAERTAAGNSREIFIDQPPGGGDDMGAVYDGSRSSSSSVPSRTESSTSISSIASSSTTGGVSSTRRSGLARRVSSSTQPDKRNTKIAVTAAAGSNARSKSAKPLSSSSSIPAPSTPGSISRTAAKQLATSGELSSAGGVRRQKGSASTSTKDDGVGSSVTTAETTSMEHENKTGRGLIQRRNSMRTGQLVDKGEVDVVSPSSGRKLPQIVDSHRSGTPDTDALRGCTPSSDAMPGNRKSTADSSTDATSTSKPSRMQQPSVSAVPRQSPSPISPRLSSPATNSCDSADVEQHRQTPFSASQDDGQPTTPVSGGSVTAPPSPAISGGQLLMYRSASVGRPTKEKSSSSISSGFGDESNNSTSDSTDSVIFQPPSASSTVSRQNASRSTGTASSTVNALCESSSSAIDSDSPPSERTAGQNVESSGADCSSPVSSPQSPPPTHQTVDHITSLRGSRRQSSEDGAPAVKVVSSPVDQCNAPTPSSDNSVSEPTSPRTTELIDAFDAIKPMQPLIRSSIPCCVYEPSTRRLPTLLAQSAAGVPSHRLVFSRPPIGPGVAMASGRGALVGRAGTRTSGDESTAACGYMSDGDVVRGCGSGRAAVGRATDRMMSGYTSEGGGSSGVSSYARRMQQRFLEGILAVRQSMERTPQFTDDDRSEAFT